jgi:hypothetical protein
MPPGRDDRGTLAAAIAEHRAAIAAFAEAVRQLPESTWATPPREQAWTPAQLTEHLCLACETIERELRGGEGLRLRTGLLLRTLVRAIFLPRILRTRRLPRRTRAPRELAPITVTGDRASGLSRLAQCAAALEAAVEHAQNQGVPHLTHHVFGRLDLPTGVRFCAIHAEHHQRQLG